MHLDYNDYLFTLFTVPLCTGLLGLIVLIGLIITCVNFIKANNQKKGQKVGILLLKSIPFSIGIPLALVFVIMSGTQLKIGVPLLFENKDNAITLEGEITDLEVDDLARTTYDAEGNPVRAHYVYFNKLRLYCSNVGDFQKGDTVLVRYMPQSGVILDIKQGNETPSLPPAQQPQNNPDQNRIAKIIIFVILFVATYLVNFVRYILARTNSKSEAWEQNTIELKYKDGLLLTIIRCMLGCIMLFVVPNSYLLSVSVIVVAILGLIKTGHKRPLVYDENGITITAINGKMFSYTWDQIISITQEQHFRLGNCIRITYRLESGRHESILFSNFYHVGTDRFLKISNQYLHRSVQSQE